MNLKRMWRGGNSRNHGRFTEGTLHERRTLVSLSGQADRPAGERDVAERLYYLGLETRCLPATGSPQYRWLVLAPFI
jgi:hypothetical protein